MNSLYIPEDLYRQFVIRPVEQATYRELRIIHAFVAAVCIHREGGEKA